ncbi:hypothetical protein P8C59_000155 [Phyllachora maydis]|uniref:DUF2293 domain-containing protein n=1 Tax=Phyllachora maydis TaxID=1825666 RepID=A0AAD9HVJ3_9PEZI|nr:hypothetical protein P8C59_000155 [Phyllachora maydis]
MGSNCRRAPPIISTKHRCYFELVENKDKKKKLDFETTENKEPPPGFEFVPIGNPVLTKACKELSREQGALIFFVILPTVQPQDANPRNNMAEFEELGKHLNRIGLHVRASIVEEARGQLAALGHEVPYENPQTVAPGRPEPIPAKQEDVNKQADAAIRDLFPRIPNPDRERVIGHSFSLKRLQNDEKPVGLASDLPLYRRVQLAVLAHIRHNFTSYDELLRQTSYSNARRLVQPICLDYLVKWRGDEETGRDQLDEILQEVIVISDSESDDDDRAA